MILQGGKKIKEIFEFDKNHFLPKAMNCKKINLPYILQYN